MAQGYLAEGFLSVALGYPLWFWHLGSVL